MTIKELMECYTKNDNYTNIELIVWDSAENHKNNYLGYPHEEYSNNFGSTEFNSLKLTDDKLQTDGAAYVDINKEIDDRKIDFYTLNQEEYFEWDNCPGINLEDEPENTLIIAIDHDCISYAE